MSATHEQARHNERVSAAVYYAVFFSFITGTQACAKCSHAGIAFTKWLKKVFFATHCANKREIWHKISRLLGAETWEYSPQSVKISNIGHKFVPQGRLLCTIFTKFSAFVCFCR